MKGLKRIIKRLEDVMTAAAFAEEGDAETARVILKEESGKFGLRKRTSGRRPMVLKPNHS